MAVAVVGEEKISTTLAIISNVKQQIELLKRHAHILEILVKSNRPVGILKLSKQTSYPPHQVRYSLRELEHAQIITASTKGARLNGDIRDFLSKLETNLSELDAQLKEFSSKVKNIRESMK